MKEILTEDREVKNRWREYFDNLLSVANERKDLPTVKRTEGPVQKFSKEEIKKAVNEMKSGKAAGCSGFIVELIKAGLVWVRNRYDTQYHRKNLGRGSHARGLGKEHYSSNLQAEGDPMDYGNNRGIKMLEQIMNVLNRF